MEKLTSDPAQEEFHDAQEEVIEKNSESALIESKKEGGVLDLQELDQQAQEEENKDEVQPNFG